MILGSYISRLVGKLILRGLISSRFPFPVTVTVYFIASFALVVFLSILDEIFISPTIPEYSFGGDESSLTVIVTDLDLINSSLILYPEPKN